MLLLLYILWQEHQQPAVPAHKMPFFGTPFQPVLEHKTTEPKPFSFEATDRHRMAVKEQKIQQLYEQEKKVSIALPGCTVVWINFEC